MDVVGLQIPATAPTLSKHAFGYSVEGEELELGSSLAHFKCYFAEGDERLASIDVDLIDLICKKDNLLARTPCNEIAHVVFREHGACWVAGVNDDEGADREALAASLRDAVFQKVNVESPVLVLVEGIWDDGAA